MNSNEFKLEFATRTRARISSCWSSPEFASPNTLSSQIIRAWPRTSSSWSSPHEHELVQVGVRQRSQTRTSSSWSSSEFANSNSLVREYFGREPELVQVEFATRTRTSSGWGSSAFANSKSFKLEFVRVPELELVQVGIRQSS